MHVIHTSREQKRKKKTETGKTGPAGRTDADEEPKKVGAEAPEAGPPAQPPAPASAPPPAAGTEQIHMARDAEVVLSRAGADGEESEGVHVSFYDMGGQPEFWALAGEFLRW